MVLSPTQKTSRNSKPLAVVYRPCDALTYYSRNARTHSDRQLEQIAASIREFGFTNPILIDDNGTILAGHGRVEAAKRLGLAEVPTIRIEDLTEAQKRAYILADNRLAEKAGWDPDILGIELQELTAIDLGFELEVTGFETAEIDLLIDGLNEIEPDPAEQVPEIDRSVPAISQPGDLWLLGKHKLYCGDALDGASYVALMGEDRAQVVFTDPPYNVVIDGHVCGSGAIKHREFQMASGEMSEEAFEGFLEEAFVNLAEFSVDGSIHFICMDWRHMVEILTAGRSVYSELKNLCVWNKSNGGMGSFYRSKHELVFVFKSGTAKHINTFGLGNTGRYRTNVWDYAGVNSFGKGNRDKLKLHPTVKPIAMVSDAIKDCSKRRHIVLDAFCGSGTTILAAERTGRIARAIELDPLYVDVAIRRFEEMTSDAARLVHTNQTFADVAAERLGGQLEEGHYEQEWR